MRPAGRWRFSAALAVALGLLTAACAIPPTEAPQATAEPVGPQIAALNVPPPVVEDGDGTDQIPAPHIESVSKRLQCVPFARELSGINIRGDAWSWWASAAHRYHRGQIPAEGSVLVFKRKGKRGKGHVAVVTHVLSGREIVVDHANWLKGGRIHRSERVRDISPDNDWSSVRVWYTPGSRYGKAPYATYGFIYPVIASEPLNLRLDQKTARVAP